MTQPILTINDELVCPDCGARAKYNIELSLHTCTDKCGWYN